MKSKFGDKARLQHIFKAILEIESYITKVTFRIFNNNSMMKYACIKQLEIIGEAANQLSNHFKKLHPEIEWREIIGLRNILVHEYFGVDEKIIWNIIKKDLPKLKKKINFVLKQI